MGRNMKRFVSQSTINHRWYSGAPIAQPVGLSEELQGRRERWGERKGCSSFRLQHLLSQWGHQSNPSQGTLHLFSLEIPIKSLVRGWLYSGAIGVRWIEERIDHGKAGAVPALLCLGMVKTGPSLTSTQRHSRMSLTSRNRCIAKPFWHEGEFPLISLLSCPCYPRWEFISFAPLFLLHCVYVLYFPQAF